mgnify:CR=1 FL=1
MKSTEQNCDAGFFLTKTDQRSSQPKSVRLLIASFLGISIFFLTSCQSLPLPFLQSNPKDLLVGKWVFDAKLTVEAVFESQKIQANPIQLQKAVEKANNELYSEVSFTGSNRWTMFYKTQSKELNESGDFEIQDVAAQPLVIKITEDKKSKPDQTIDVLYVEFSNKDLIRLSLPNDTGSNIPFLIFKRATDNK